MEFNPVLQHANNQKIAYCSYFLQHRENERGRWRQALHGREMWVTKVKMNTKVEEILHMEGGARAYSYADNSLLQKAIITKIMPILEESLTEFYGDSKGPPTCMKIADLGCASGPNALMASSEIISATYATCKHKNILMPEFQLSLNDLPGTDFNSLFTKSLPRFHRWLEQLKERNSRSSNCQPCSCYISATPGSFFGRLFPNNALHFAHASSSLHFLSKVPNRLVGENGVAPNRGTICIAESSSPQVHKAYHEQFIDDFTLFLKSRANEIVPGGRMVLTFRISTKSDKPDYLWDFQFLGMALKSMVKEGLIREEKLDEFNVPFYTPTVKEVKELIEAEGSFTLHRFETFCTDWGDPINMGSGNETLFTDLNARAKFVEDGYRAATGPIMAAEFGEAIIDGLFYKFRNIVLERLKVGNLDILNTVMSLARRG